MLDERDCIQINIKGDPGTMQIVSTRPVTVVSGAKMTSSVIGFTSGHVVSQRLPTSFWGKTFVIALPALQGRRLYIDVVGKLKNYAIILVGPIVLHL